MPDSTIDSLEFPVIVERKHNGFLGIAFYDTDTDKIRIYSKGGSDVYSPLAETMLKQLGWYDRLVRYYEDKVNQDTTVLFEIVVPNRSQHPIRYESNAVFPLAIIKNDMSGAVLNLKPDLNHEHSLRFRDLADDIANENVIGKADNIEELKKLLKLMKLLIHIVKD
ncbi:MAG TPA: T4 RnlA family RNA ligase [Candidatus Limosilactobacillus intestinavium]|nr:T4 RnlA family RNA ligase [Candidatus Limosilactobacillus intestinavium]